MCREGVGGRCGSVSWLLIEVNSAFPCPTLPPGRVPHEHRFPRSGGCVLGIIKREF